jgi:LPS-assembly protein
MKLRFTPITLALLALLATPSAWAQSVADESATLPAPALKLAPQLTAPSSRRASASAPSGEALPGAPLKLAPLDPGAGPVYFRADRMEGVAEKFVEAEGRVELRTRRETVRADWLHYDLVADEVWGKGDVMLRRGIDWITGPETRYKRDTQTGFFREPHFYVGENGAHGSAAELRFAGPQRFDATDARYTTCVAPREDWYIRMNELEVDQSRMVGTGRDATLYFLGAPIGYTPWFEFPLSGQRKSGFLMPTLGSSGSRGFETAVPYYLNLAPDYDATITPRIMTKRGVQLGAQFRYLRESFTGEMDAQYLNNDRVTGTNRYALSWKHNQNLDAVPGLAAYWNLNKVSDDTYFSDLSDRIAFTSQTSLPREGGVVWTRGPLSLLVRAQAFQTLNDPTAPPATPSYNRLPQVVARFGETEWAGLDFELTADATRFRQSALPEGDRFYAYPTVAWSRRGAAWFFTARGGVHARHYALDPNSSTGSSLGVTIPIVSVDAGLIFERDGSAFGERFVQTLEPRAFYTWIPYRDQSAIPNFDSAVDDFTFGQLFTENRYLGNDRIGDANQLTLAVTSRILDPGSGAERLRLALGQRLYFSDQKVTLTETPRSASSSDLLVGAEGRLSDVWSLAGLLQFNLDTANTERLNLGARYTPAPGKVFNASYRYNPNLADPSGGTESLKQFDLSTQWPLGDNWSFLGRWNYSLVDGKTLEGVAGVEYNGGCWVVRVVGQRLATTTQTTTTSVYAQLELNGLARFGTSPLELLRRTVPGYRQTNQPLSSQRESAEGFAEF